METAASEALLLMGHGSRDDDGVGELRRLVDAVRAAHGGVVAAGVLEFDGPGNPSIQQAIDACVASGARRIVGQPLLLLCGDHARGDMPAQAEAARQRHPGLAFVLGEHLGLHDALLEIAAERAAEAERRLGGPVGETALLLCARGSYRPESNACMVKAGRLAWERSRARAQPWDWVETCFVSLAPPSVAEGIRRCARLGARRVVVVPYFLNTGLLVKRIGLQAASTAADLPGVEVAVAGHMGVDGRVVDLIVRRAREAGGATVAEGYCCGSCRRAASGG